MSRDPFFIPVALFITQRWGGAYHGASDWPEGTPRQEPDTFVRRPIIGLAYDVDIASGWPSEPQPRWAVLDDGHWVDIRDQHWYFGISADPDIEPPAELR